MSLDQIKVESNDLEVHGPPDSPQPLQLTTTPAASSKASSRCSSPLSDQNGSAEEEEPVTSLNLTINKSIKVEPSFLPELSPKSRPSNGDAHDLTMRIPTNLKMIKSEGQARSGKSLSRLPSLNTSPMETLPNSPDFNQLLLEYRTVLLDTLTKAILQSSSEESNNEKGVVLPAKCQCGFTSELSKQITRTSTYVHQLELRFRALIEKTSHESKYTPKRPWFITAAQQVPGSFQSFATSTPVSMKLPHASLLEKSKRMRSAAPAPVDLKSVSLYSGNSSITSSLNGDEEDVDSEEDDVNGDNLPLPTVVSAVAAASAGNLMTANGTMIEPNGANGVSSAAGGKTILEGYLESVRAANVLPTGTTGMVSEDGSDDEDEDDLNGPSKRIDPKTKKQVLQMQRNGASINDISRAINISRKSIRRIITNYRAYESRLQKNLQDSILKLYSQGRSYTQIARSTGVSKPTIAKIIKQYIDSTIFTKGPTNGLMQNGVTQAAANLTVPNDHFEEDDDEEREMVVDEDAADDEDDLEDEEDNINDEASAKNVIDGNASSFSILSNKLSLKTAKQQRNTSLLYNAFDGSQQQSKQALGNGSVMHGGRMSLIKQSDRFKPYEGKLRNPVNHDMLGHQHPRMPKQGHPIVPPLPASTNMYSGIRSSGLKVHTNGNLDNCTVRIKGTKPRHSQDGLLVPEADKNNNTTLNSCNLSITSTNGKSTEEVSTPPGQLPPIPASLIEGNSDSEANLVPKNFIENFPAGISKIVNSLNPNRATKLTLEDFNIVWQLRSQHWTHNQIRKYFQQRGKSISKSSISRIMNGKQRNFQQFFNVVPSSF